MKYYQQHLNEKPKTILFHYTTQAGLMGIIKTKKIWATNIHYLNDSGQFSHAVDMLNNGIDRFRDNRKTVFMPHILKFRDRIRQLSNIGIYVCSFSAAYDLLSQWRGYADNGVGVSLGLNFNDLLPLIEKQGFSILKCEYSNSIQMRIIDDLLEIFLKDISKTGKRLNPDKTDKYETCHSEFMQRFIGIAPTLKHPSFKEEREWRLISKPIPYNDPHLEFRGGSSMLIPYCNMELCKSGSILNIEEIVVGPNPYQDLAINSVSSFISTQRDVNLKTITPSQTRYRSEERRVGKEWRSRWSPYHEKKKR